MAPVQGVTNCTYRNAYSRSFAGYDRCVTPFIKSTAGRKSSLKDILPKTNDVSFEIIPQLLDNNPKTFISASKGIFDLGYKTVNWNLGCPLPMVRKKKRGSGLLPFTSDIVRFLEKVLPQAQGSVSLKVRLGAKDKGELLKLLPLLNDLPLEEIIIHPRTGTQMYKGVADISSFEECLSLTTHTIVYSGDITSCDKFHALAKKFPAINRWMIGRGGIVDPFLPEEIKGLRANTKQEKLDIFIRFHDDIFMAYQSILSGPAHLIGKMKEKWRFWVQAYEGGDRLFLEISKAKTVDEYRTCVDKFFSKKLQVLPEGRT
ncbi:MAG: tRNA-dihydrouridine synthase family protein [Candidatus Tantalella remota]|nr:tRNA-dihydrouridine synthase family protein [Candidatus Tantalella remota]